MHHDDEMPTNIGKKQPPTRTSIDNQDAKKIADSTRPSKRSKHIEV
jgi:hypothetical protein